MGILPGIFILTLVLITVFSLRLKVPPFFTLLAGALFFGLASGMDLDQAMKAILGGLGRVFSMFAIIILSGAIIAKTLQAQGMIGDLVDDLQKRTRNGHTLAGIGGYLFAIPTTCCITAFVMLTPVLERLGKENNEGRSYMYLAAVGSVLSYTLIYPTPVVIPLFSSFGKGASPLIFNLVAIPLSLLLLIAVIIVFRARFIRSGRQNAVLPGSSDDACGTYPGIHWKAWAPFLAIMLAIPVFSLIIPLSHESLIQCIMIVGLAVALILATSSARAEGIHKGTMHAGMIMFDICGAGALGNVIAVSGFSGEIFPLISGTLPIVLIPFAFTALVQAAQGSRVVSAVIASEVLSGTAIAASMHPIPLILSVAAGTCVISYLSDPYFWLLQRTTGDSAGGVVKHYSLPLCICGLAALSGALALQALLGPPT